MERHGVVPSDRRLLCTILTHQTHAQDIVLHALNLLTSGINLTAFGIASNVTGLVYTPLAIRFIWSQLLTIGEDNEH